MNEPRTRIAIVDDEQSIRRALLRLMRSAGLAAQAFDSGAAFLESLSEFQPDCVVLDLHMPGLSGFDVQQRLARDWPAVAVIAVTGHHSSETQARALLTAPLAYLHKPMDDQTLLDAVARAAQLRQGPLDGPQSCPPAA